ncbi:MAG TPA: hypothetical protein VNX26_13815 [Candidatus Acidoferrum sp.]|nr:hypothetical protein [Candidatus Acidoferrum sp.]
MAEDGKVSDTWLGAMAGLMGSACPNSFNRGKSVDPEKSERIRRIDQQMAELLRERWRVVKPVEDKVAHAWVGAAAGLAAAAGLRVSLCGILSFEVAICDLKNMSGLVGTDGATHSPSGRYGAVVHLPANSREIVRSLQIHPELGGVSEISCQKNGCLRRNSTVTTHELIHAV